MIRRLLRASTKSPSEEAMERTYNRSFLSGGTTVDFSANVDNIREISRKLGYDILNTNKTNPIQQRNLLQFSEELTNSFWSKQATTVVATGTMGYFGTPSYFLKEDTANNTHLLFTNQLVSTGSVYTTSYYVKKAQDTWVQFLHTNNFNPNSWVNFNFDTGEFGNSGSGATYTKQFLTNGFWVITVTSTATDGIGGPALISGINNTNTPSRLGGASYTGTLRNVVEISAIQSEIGSGTTTYQATPLNSDFTSASFTYVPSAYGEGKNFSETQNNRNILQWSEDFSNPSWSKVNSIVTTNTNINPFGVAKSYYLIDNNTNGSHNISQSISTPIGQSFAVSFYVKKADDTWCQFALGAFAFGNNYWVNFNFDTGLFGNSGGSGNWIAEPLRNGYWLIKGSGISTLQITGSPSVPIGTNNTNTAILNPTYIGTNRKYCDIAAMQVETGLYTSPYQKTVATGDGIIDFNFTRVTSSRVTNKQGIIEDSCYNLLQRSEEFDNAIWLSDIPVIARFANTTIAPNGTLTADKITESTSLSVQDIYQQVNINSLNQINIFSVYLKAAERNIARVTLGNISLLNGVSCYFDLSNGTIVNGPIKSGIAENINATITDADNGWYRCSVTCSNLTGTTLYNAIWIRETPTDPSYIGVLGSGIYVWGAQLNIGSELRPYLRTTNRLNVPKLDYSRNLVTSNNLLLFSEDFENTIWVKTSITVSENLILNPFNINKSYYLLENTNNDNHGIYQMITLVSGITYTASFYVKKADVDWVQILTTSSNFTTNTFWFNVNLTTGQFGNQGSGFNKNITALSNGWYKIDITATANVTGSGNGFIIEGTNNIDVPFRSPIYVGTNGVRICNLAAIQLEIGSTPTSYQKTLNSNTFGTKPSLLIEQQRSNLALQSETFDNASWAKNNITATVNTNINPFGISKSYYINENNTTNTHFLSQNRPITSGLTYTASFYVKKADDTWIQLALGTPTFGTDVWINFNFDTGQFGNGGTTGTWRIRRLSNGYWLITVTAISIATVTSNINAVYGCNNSNTATRGISYLGTTGRRIADIACVQLELGSNATSPITTLAAAVTRNGDASFVDLWNNNMLNKENFTLFWEGFLYDGGPTNGFGAIALSDTSHATSVTNQIGWYYLMKPYYHIGGGGGTGTDGNIANTFNRFVIQYNNGIANYFLNGINVLSNVSVPVFDYRYLVINTGGATHSTDKLILFKNTLTNVECISLTSPTYNTFEALASAYTYTLIV